MRLLSLEYWDHALDWHLKPMTFNPLTLLVGASGVGKTQILRAILNLKGVAKGNSANGLQWRLQFSTLDDAEYVWEGEFETRDVSPQWIGLHVPGMNKSFDEADAPSILWERLTLGDNQVIERDQETIVFQGSPTARLPRQKSIVYLLKEESKIAPAYHGLQRVISDDQWEIRGRLSVLRVPADPPLYQQARTIEGIRQSSAHAIVKTYLASKFVPKIFAEIKDRFTDVFPFVEDLRVEPQDIPGRPSFLREMPVVQIKEKGIDQWIDETLLSSGMYRTLLLISEAYLCADGTVVLVDEFENSLGVNCIDDLTEEILSHERKIQFVITSHHPYIINKVNPANWKIITRKAGVVTARDAPELNFSKSKHEAFIQLINRPEYAEGIEV